MKMNGKNIRIREIKEADLEWSDYVDIEAQDLTVPCFFKSEKFLYTGFLRPSLDLLHFRKLCEERSKKGKEKYIFTRNDVEYTDVFLIVNMNGAGRGIDSGEYQITSGYVYQYGIYEQEDAGKYVKYVEYKRSGNAAKKGKHIFIREDFYKDMVEWSWLGSNPKEIRTQMSYVEMKAYESLVNSTIKNIVSIAPEEILLLYDIRHSFPTRITRVKKEGEAFYVDRGEDEVTNVVTDGECLLDDSVFEAAQMDAGMMLLRNFFFKSCGFRADIQGYYREVFGDDYETATVQNCFGEFVKVSRIKMIVTLSSFKVFKFKEFFGMQELAYEMGMSPEQIDMDEAAVVCDEEDAYQWWCRKVQESENIFGIVKNEEAHRDKRKFTYQMLNSMPFTEADIDELMNDDIEKLVSLRTDYEAYEAYIGNGKEAVGEVNPIYTEQFMMDLVKQNPVFRQTEIYKRKRNNDIQAFKQKLYEGKITIDADYCTLCSMPFELLQYSVTGDTDAIRPVLQKGEVCIPGLEEGEQLTLCRNPHTCASNVVCAVNRNIPEIERWFHFKRKNGHSNIVVLSPWEWDVMEALNGADFDSDEVLCIRDKTVWKRAMVLQEQEQITAIPHAYIETDGKSIVDTEDFLAHYETDNALSGNKIGIISNYAQMLNGLYWDSASENTLFEKDRQELYDDIQILSILMGLEIDKAKHAYSFDAKTVARQIAEKYLYFEKNHLINRPIFMCFINERKHNLGVAKAKLDQWLNCPMDYVAKKMFYLYRQDERLNSLKQIPTVKLTDIFEVDDYKGCDAHKVETILNKIGECIRVIKPLNQNTADLDWADNEALKENTLEETYRLMEKNKISIKEMKRMLYIILEKDTIARMKNIRVRKAFYECLMANNRESVLEITGEKTLEKTNYGVINQTSTAYIDRAKESSDKQQINYTKCKKIFEKFLEIDYTEDKVRERFAQSLKKDKNLLNTAYMLQVITDKKEYAEVKKDKLMVLALLYHVWPEYFMECVKMQKTEF